ncbi:MAG: hypothetical protein IJM51_00225 [Clostridia bacterium]|nr:hypothetical protein [Clostridia bacterium]
MARLANRKKYQKKRETFMQFYNRTCDRVFGYAFERCLNRADTMIVCREAFIDMYFDISDLRTAPNVDYWQRKQVDKTLRYLVRKNRLSLIHEKTLADIPDSLTADEKEDLWRRINRTIDIDPWRLVPVPGRTSVFTVLADQAASDMSYMSPLDIAKAAGIVLLIFAMIGGAGFGAYCFLFRGSSGGVEAMEEIFLDERSYDAYNEESRVRVTDEDINRLIREAFGGLDDEGGLSSHSAVTRNSSKEPVYTADDAINDRLKVILDEILTDEMSDTERLWAIYYYVGTHIRYETVSDRSEEQLKLLRYYFKHQTGDSRHYAMLFQSLCNAAGYDCEMIKGRFVLNGDTEFRRDILHYWNRMRLNGMYYYYDCEADTDEFGTQVREYYFMATDGNTKWSVWNRDHQ